jgi:hypothetical protein
VNGEGSRFRVKREFKGFKAREIQTGPMKSIKSVTQRLPLGHKEDTVAFLATNWEKNLKKFWIQTLV